MTEPAPPTSLARRHLAFGWGMLAVFIALGIALEALHALKLGFYLDTSNETRRLMWTLSHAHGSLFGLVHIAFALSIPQLASLLPGAASFASRCLYVGSVAMPLGFLLGGVFVYEGDPGLPVLLAPIGAALVLLAVIVIARGTRARSPDDADR